MILFGSGTGVLIEAWKVPLRLSLVLAALTTHLVQITKAVDISVIAAPAGSLLPYKLDIKGSCSSDRFYREPNVSCQINTS